LHKSVIGNAAQRREKSL